MAFISQEEFEAKLGRSLTASEVSTFDIINAANQAYVEKFIGSSLEEEEAATRYYDGGLQHTPIDPCTDITAVALVDEYQNIVDTIDVSDYVKEPINRTLKTMIRYRFGRFYTGITNMAVTAKFSIAEDTGTVALVKAAMLEALAFEIDSSDNVVKESIEGYSVEKAKPESKSKLDAVKFLFQGII